MSDLIGSPGKPLDTSTPPQRDKRRQVKSTQEMRSLKTRPLPSQVHGPHPTALKREKTSQIDRPRSGGSTIDGARHSSQPKKRIRRDFNAVSPINTLKKIPGRENKQNRTPRSRAHVLIDDTDRGLRGAPAMLELVGHIKLKVTTQDRHIYEYPLREIDVTYESANAERVKACFQMAQPCYAQLFVDMKRSDLGLIRERMNAAGNMRRYNRALSDTAKWTERLETWRKEYPGDNIYAIRIHAVRKHALNTDSPFAALKVNKDGLTLFQLNADHGVLARWKNVSMTLSPHRPFKDDSGIHYAFEFRDPEFEEYGEIVVYPDKDVLPAFDECVRQFYPPALKKIDRSGRVIDIPRLTSRHAEESVSRSIVSEPLSSPTRASNPGENRSRTKLDGSDSVKPSAFYGAKHESTPARILPTPTLDESPSSRLSIVPSVTPKVKTRTKQLRALSLTADEKPDQPSSPTRAPSSSTASTPQNDDRIEKRSMRPRRIYVEEDPDLFEAESPSKRKRSMKKSEQELPQEPTESDYAKLIGLGYRQFSYDFWDKRSTDVHIEDIARLEPHVYLNDTVISFFLKRAQERLASTEPDAATGVLVLNTFFFTRISKQREVPEWVNKLSMLTKRIIVMPIHENLHWKVAVIIGLDRLAEGHKPKVCVLDSLGDTSPRAAYRKVVSFLCKVIGAQGYDSIGPKSFANVNVTVPIQPNLTDCGVFLVHYVERILDRLNDFVQKLSDAGENGNFDSLEFWNPEDLDNKRSAMLAELKELGQALSKSEEPLVHDGFSSSQVLFTAPAGRVNDSVNDVGAEDSDDGLEVLEINSIKEKKKAQRAMEKSLRRANLDRQQSEAAVGNSDSPNIVSRLRPRSKPQFPTSPEPKTLEIASTDLPAERADRDELPPRPDIALMPSQPRSDGISSSRAPDENSPESTSSEALSQSATDKTSLEPIIADAESQLGREGNANDGLGENVP